MNSFEKTTLGSLVEFQRGYDLPKSEFINGIYPVRSSNGILGYHNQYKCKAPGITIGRSGTVGLPHYIEDDFFPHNTTLFIKDFKGNLPRYIYYLIENLKLNDWKSGSGVPTLNRNHLHPIEIKAHTNLNDQKQIAKVLSDLDAKIEINNKINQELEALSKTIYVYWFVQFDFPDANGKPYKSSGGKMVYNEELKREIPEGWEVKPLTEEMDLQYGFPFSTKLFNEEEIGIPIIRIRDIQNGTISYYSTESVHEKYKLNKGDVLVGMDGNFHINYWNLENCYLNQRCLRIRSKSNSISETQARYMIEPYIQAREKNVSRTTVAHLSARDINDLRVVIAHSELQKKSNRFFKSNLKKIVSNREENKKLTKLRDWLLPMLMNGQVTVGTKSYTQNKDSLGMVAEEKLKYGEK